jgi:hypothetical protein
MKTGFEDCQATEALFLLGNDGKIRDSPEFSEIWRVKFPIEEQSAETTKVWIDESTIFHGKTSEDSQATRVPVKNRNLARNLVLPARSPSFY